MYYINDYRNKSVEKIIPYLIEFPQIIKNIEISADRYQAIEDVLWNIADNFKVSDARGIFLDVHAHNEDSNIIYTDKADDAFTYGTTIPEKQAYGTGHYYSQTSYLSGIKKTISEDKMIRGILAKIIENNTNATIEDLIEALKLYYNAEKISILESYPLSISLMLNGKDIELSTTGNKEIIKEFLPACVSLKNLYLNDKQFNIYQLGQDSSYGNTRYALDVTENYVSYPFYAECINLNSQNNEYIKTNHNELSENMYCCFTGELTESYSGNNLLSSTNGNNSFCLNINSQLHFELLYNNIAYNTPILAEAGKTYTFILLNSNNQLKLWVFSGAKITGEDKDKDEAYITNQMLNAQPDVTINNYSTINNAPIYINGLQNGTNVICGDFTYYGIMFGNILNDVNDVYEYYVTSYGQKQILFNCISNNNHLKIHSNEAGSTGSHIELTRLQSEFKYAKNHASSKYAYFDGKSNVKYDTSKLFDRSKFTVVGNPIISVDGIARGFHEIINYIKTPNNIQTSSTMTICTKFNSGNDFSANPTICSLETITCFGIRINNNSKMQYYISNDGSAWTTGGVFGDMTISKNTDYYCKMEAKPNDIKFYLSTDGKNWILDKTITDTIYATNEHKVLIGVGRDTGNPFNGSIDLKQSSITSDGIEVFNGNKYLVHNNEYIDDFNLDISLCTPISLNESNVLSGFIYNENIDSEIFITDSNGLVVTLPIFNISNNTYQQLTLTTPDNVLFNNMFNDISIRYVDNKINIYNNNETIYSLNLNNNLKFVYRAPIINIGNKEYLGLIKRINLNYDVKGNIINIDLPYMYTLRDDINKVLYVNEGVRLITAPQLMNDETNLDLYGNTFIGVK